MNEKINRTCATCACFAMQESPLNPLEKTGICRLNNPMLVQAEIASPRLDKDKNVIPGKDGRPIMEKTVKQIFVYSPTVAELTCFAGWRPIGTEPGDSWHMNPQHFLPKYLALMEEMGFSLPKIPLDG